MLPKDIIIYARQELAAGRNPEGVKRYLLDSGYDIFDIEAFFKSFE